ncbi:hypothetical protein [Massilia sp. S19_KUP03_FR1]|uniref:hypothetical protein n=1 Tax=Massilia sp. S19_KUP03_FR1 TaxID=3025503 RepID=UPI002FCDC731
MYTVLLLSTFLVGARAQAEHKEDCDRAEYSQQYAAGFNRELNGALDRFKNQDKSSRSKLDGMKAASDFKVQLLSLDGIPMIAGGNKAAELRATCLLGPNAISKADVLYAVTERAWKLLESKVAAEAQVKKVTMP